MKYKSRVCFLLFAFCLFLTPAVIFGDEDPSDYMVAVSPGFQIVDQNYGKFQTPEYALQPALNNLLISVDLNKSPEGVIRSYVRFKYEKTGLWTDFKEFENEFHFASVQTVSTYQVMFVMLDFSKGKNQVRRISIQGKKLDEDIMEWLLQDPAPYEPAKVWPKPAIVSRSAWGARPPKGSYSGHRPLRIILHHSWLPTQAQYNGAATIRGIQNYHMDASATGWSDIGYHFLIGPDGVIYQGRPENVVGAHVQPNTNNVGICMIGNYDEGEDKMNDKIEKSVIELMSWLASTYRIDPKVNVYGHCDFSSKSCPGTAAYKELPRLRGLIAGNIGKR